MAFNAATGSWDVPETDTVYFSGVPPDTTEAHVADHFGTIGILRVDKKRGVPRVWLYRDKASGDLKGDGTASYEDPVAAASAVKWFDGKDFRGVTLKVSLAEARGGGGGGGGAYPGAPAPSAYGGGDSGGYGRGGGGGYDRGGGGGGGRGRGRGGVPGDWHCACGNLVFSRNRTCRMCGAEKPDGGGGGGYGGAPPPQQYGGGGGPPGGGYGGPPPSSYGGGAPPPPANSRPGDWQCACGNLVFARNRSCRMCGAEKPGGGSGGGGYDDRRRPDDRGGRDRGGGYDDRGYDRERSRAYDDRRRRSRSRSRERR